MSAERFCAVLEEIGYGSNLDPNGFEWAFDGETKTLMEWLCSNLRPANVLSFQELEEYNELVSSGKVLQGELLENAFSTISAFEPWMGASETVFGEMKSIKEIREEAVHLRGEAGALRSNIRKMEEYKAHLAKHNASLLQDKQRKKAANLHMNKLMTDLATQLSDRNLQLNRMLDSLATCVQELSGYYSAEGEGVFLSSRDLRPYIKQERECSKELELWYKKQFDEGPSRLVIKEGLSNCSWVSLDDVTNRFVKGDLESSYQQRVMEIRRLRSIFQVSLREWVEVRAEVAQRQAELAQAKVQGASIRTHHRQDAQHLRRRQVDLDTDLSSLRIKEREMRDKLLPHVCQTLADLQDTYILQGDYDLKIMRQEYCIAQQKKYIGHLVQQGARHEFLHMACDAESVSHRGAAALLQLTDAELGALQEISRMRQVHYRQVTDLLMQDPKSNVSDRDRLLVRIRAILDLEPTEWEREAQYVEVERLKDAAGKLLEAKEAMARQASNSSSSSHALPTLWQHKMKHVDNLIALVRRMHELLFGSPSASGRPILTPEAVAMALTELERMDVLLSDAIKAIQMHQEDHLQALHTTEIACMRQVFKYFFCSPDELRRVHSQLLELKQSQGSSSSIRQ